MKKLIFLLTFISLYSCLQAQCDARYFRKCAVTELLPGLSDFKVTQDNGDKSGSWEGSLNGQRIIGTYAYDHSAGRFVATVNAPVVSNPQPTVQSGESGMQEERGKSMNTSSNRIEERIETLEGKNQEALSRSESALRQAGDAEQSAGRALLEIDDLQTKMLLLERRMDQLEAGQKNSGPAQTINSSSFTNSNPSPVRAQKSSKPVAVSRYSPDMTLYLGFGVRPLKYGDLDIEFEYIDESPSHDHIYEYYQLDKRSSAFSLNAGFEYFDHSNWFYHLEGELYFGEVRGGGADFGMGYHFDTGKGFEIRPSLGLGMNYTRVELGDIYQNSVYIQVNDTKFYSRSVGIRVSSPSLSLRPQVAFVLPVLDNYEVRLGMGYHINLARFSSDLQFSGEDENRKSISDSKPLKAANAYLGVNGRRTTTSFASPQGFFIHACFGLRM